MKIKRFNENHDNSVELNANIKDIKWIDKPELQEVWGIINDTPMIVIDIESPNNCYINTEFGREEHINDKNYSIEEAKEKGQEVYEEFVMKMVHNLMKYMEHPLMIHNHHVYKK